MKQRGKHSALSRLLTGGLALALSLNLLPGAVLAAEVEGKTLYEDTFESGTLSEQWTKPSDSDAYTIVENGIDDKSLLLQSTMQNDPNQDWVGWEWRMSYNPENPAEWQDYSIQMDLKLGDELTAGTDYNNPTWNDDGYCDSISIMGRMGSDSNPDYWGLIYRTKTHKLELNKFFETVGTAHATKEDFNLENNKVYQLKLDFHGSSISAYIAEKNQTFGDAVLTVEDTDLGTAPLTSGGWGIMVEGCQAYIDNVRVVGLLTEIPLTGLSLSQSKLSLEKDQNRQLSVNYTPADASFKDVTWSTGDANVATVDDAGNVTAVGEGTTQIKVTSDEYSNISAVCDVTVYETVDCDTFYYVATDGNDATGNGSKEKPFQTLEKARDTIRSLDTIPDGGITVYLRGGEYSLDETFTLEPEDSGEAGKPIVYASYPGEKASIVSKEYITGWEKLTQPVYGMPAESVDNVYVADIDKGWRFHFLYDDGQSQPVSAMTQSDDWMNWPQLTADAVNQKSDNGLKVYLNNGHLAGLDGWIDAEIAMSTADWWNINGVLSDIDPTSNTARLQTKVPVLYNPITNWHGGHYNLTNVPKYLDTAGEWAVDSQAGKVYYWPADGKDPDDSTMFAPKLYELVRFQGTGTDETWNAVHDITLRDLAFSYTDRIPENKFDSNWLVRNAENPDGMIFMQGVRNCTIEDCVIAYSGAQGISVDHYAQECRFIGNEIAYCSSGGIQINGYGPGNVDVNKNHLIQRNHIHNLGLDYMHSCAVQIYGSNNNIVEYNYMHDLPYAVVSIIGMRYDQMLNANLRDTWDSYGNQQSMYQARWDDFSNDTGLVDNASSKKYQHSENNITQYNICDDYMQVMNDGGALYCWASGLNKVWRNNVGERAPNDGDGLVFAIYMDHFDTYNTIQGNLFYASGWADISGQVNGETDTNQWVDNIITRDSYPAGYLDLRAQITDTANQDGGWMVSLPDSITITAPTKTEYYVGEELDLTGMTVTASIGIEYQQTITEGYTVSGYDPTKEGTQTVTVSYGGKTATFTVNVTAPETYTVTFETNGGRAIEPQTVTAGATVSKPDDPTRSGYTFAGWYKDVTLTEAYDFADEVTANLTLYAKWTENVPVGGGTTSGNKIETVTNPDGSTTTTVTKPDGSTTATTKAPDGSSSVVNTTKNGQVEAKVTVSSTAVENADDVVVLPMPEVSATTDTATAPEITVDLPAGTTTKVEIPVKNVTAGTVAVLVKADGTEEVVKTSYTTENGVVVKLKDGDTVKIINNSKDFIDVPGSFWGADAVGFVTSRELFNGTSATTFSPNGAMTRAMIVTVLARMEGVDTTTGDTWYEAGRQWAMKEGISDGTNMMDSLTREQLAAMLYRYCGSPAVNGIITGFADTDSVSDWASDAMLWAVQNGIISGSSGKLNPQGDATRAEVATMLMRFISLKVA